MKKIITLLLIIVAYATCSINAQTTEQTVTKDIDLNGSFNTIKSSTGIKVIYKVISDSEKAHAVISTDKNTIEYISVALKDETLKINFKNLNESVNKRVSATVYVYSPVVNCLNVSSGSVIIVDDGIDEKRLNMNLNASSGGQIRLTDLKCNSVKTSLSSGSILNIDNVAASTVNFSNSSGSQTKIQKISAPTIKIDSSSGSRVKIDNISSRSIDVDASSASNVTLIGKAESIDIDASSASKVNAAGLSCQSADATASSTAVVDIQAKNINSTTSSLAQINKH